MPKEIVFIIGDGDVEIKTTGFKGAACEAATKAFEEVLGGTITKKNRTGEYYEKENVVRIQQGGK